MTTELCNKIVEYVNKNIKNGKCTILCRHRYAPASGAVSCTEYFMIGDDIITRNILIPTLPEFIEPVKISISDFTILERILVEYGFTCKFGIDRIKLQNSPLTQYIFVEKIMAKL